MFNEFIMMVQVCMKKFCFLYRAVFLGFIGYCDCVSNCVELDVHLEAINDFSVWYRYSKF